jgi:hypothetical protein
MSRARMQLIALETTLYYHTISRCVHRIILCGEGYLNKKNYEPRKVWVFKPLVRIERCVRYRWTFQESSAA